MKSSKSNTKISVATFFCFEASCCDISTHVHSLNCGPLPPEAEDGILTAEDKGKVGSGLTRQQRQDFLAELAKVPKLQEPVDCPSGSICRLPGWRCRVRYFGLTEMGHLR